MFTPALRWLAPCGAALALLLGCAGRAERAEPAGNSGGSTGGNASAGGSSASPGAGGFVNSGSPCAPEGATSRSNSCNTCSCSSGAWACGHRICPTPVCSPGQTMPAGCNTCSCGSDGQWQCTLIACATPCGFGLGNTCSPSEYCAYQPGQQCGALGVDAGTSSICRVRPTGCTDEFAPVCGCDGVTYATACEANRQGQGVRSQGACALNPDGGI